MGAEVGEGRVINPVRFIKDAGSLEGSNATLLAVQSEYTGLSGQETTEKAVGAVTLEHCYDPAVGNSAHIMASVRGTVVHEKIVDAEVPFAGLRTKISQLVAERKFRRELSGE